MTKIEPLFAYTTTVPCGGVDSTHDQAGNCGPFDFCLNDTCALQTRGTHSNLHHLTSTVFATEKV